MTKKGSLGNNDGDGDENENGKNVYISKTTTVFIRISAQPRISAHLE